MLSTKFRLIWQSSFRENNFRNQSNRKKIAYVNYNICLLMDRDEMSNLYRGPFIDASYQGSVHLPKQFQRRRFKCEKLATYATMTGGRSYNPTVQ